MSLTVKDLLKPRDDFSAFWNKKAKGNIKYNKLNLNEAKHTDGVTYSAIQEAIQQVWHLEKKVFPLSWTNFH